MPDAARYNALGSFRLGYGVDAVRDVDGRAVRDLLPRGTRHSPEGHSWGYGGSGPAQLALDLLWAEYGREPAPWLYQAYKFRVIAQLDQDRGWTLAASDVRRVVDQLVAEHPDWPAFADEEGQWLTSPGS